MPQATSVAPPPGRRRSRRFGRLAADEHDRYPVHEEDNVPENPIHELVVGYLKYALRAHLPDKWVTGDVCMYWERENMQQYLAPDVLVVNAPPPDPMPPTYLKWRDPPALLVAEIGSKSTFLRDEGPRPAIYGWCLAVPEYLYYHPDRRELHLFHLEEGSYREVLPDARGRAHSETLDVWFGVDDEGRLRVYTPAGEVLQTHEEEVSARRQAELERQHAEHARQQAEHARQEERHARQQAEAHARQEAEARAAAEKRLAELEERLRRLGERPDSA